MCITMSICVHIPNYSFSIAERRIKIRHSPPMAQEQGVSNIGETETDGHCDLLSESNPPSPGLLEHLKEIHL